MLNIIKCGLVVYHAKQELEKDEWLKWLQDSRVSESERTAQRLMQIFTNYRHLLEGSEEKIGLLTKIGAMKLIELGKLPDRFKKQVKLDGKLIDVVDEEKLSQFLMKLHKGKDGQYKPMKDLSLQELKRAVKEEGGEVFQERGEVKGVEKSDILTFLDSVSKFKKYVEGIDPPLLFSLPDTEKDNLKQELVKIDQILQILDKKVTLLLGGLE